MKFILLSFLSISAFAQTQVRREFDENLERKCFKELMALGCVAKGEEVKGCAEQKKQKLSPGCQSLVEARK